MIIMRMWNTAWYNTVLLSGPPGSGKTSLACGLGQRLAIRFSDIYTGTKLLKVDSSSVIPRIYRATAKENGVLFFSIQQVAWWR